MKIRNLSIAALKNSAKTLLFASILIHTQEINAQTCTVIQTPVATPTTTQLFDVSFADNTTAYACGNLNGTILRSTNKGATWSSVFNTTTNISLRGIDFPSANVGYAVGDSMVVKYSSGTWSVIPNRKITGTTSLTCSLYGLHFRNDSVGYAVGYTGTSSRVFKTTNGGATWTNKLLGTTTTAGSTGVFFLNDNVGYVAGYGNFSKTTNAGSTWTTIAMPKLTTAAVNLATVFFTSELVGHAVGVNGYYAKTIDGGATWIPQQIGTASSNTLRDVYFVSPQVGFITAEVGTNVAGTNSKLYKTTDGGTTWAVISNNGFFFKNLDFLPDGTGLVARNTNSVLPINQSPELQISANSNTLNEGQTLSLTANSIAGATYAWTGPNGFTSAAQNPSISNLSTANAGTYNLAVSVTGCSTTQTASLSVSVASLAPTITNFSTRRAANTGYTLDTLTITGTGLNTVDSVRFGTVRGTVLNKNTTTLTVQIPHGAYVAEQTATSIARGKVNLHYTGNTYASPQDFTLTGVYIPDVNFRKDLRALNSSYMYTGADSAYLNPAVAVTLTNTLNVEKPTSPATPDSRKIANMAGVEYFTRIPVLICHNNKLTTLPANLPNSLDLISCYYNGMTSLPTLPAGLTQLLCSYNSIVSLPSLPNSLSALQCQFNQLTNLPTLPSSLTLLYCNHNKLTVLPTLPNSLITLSCDNNKLTSLPTLPNNLTRLECQNNQLTSLPTLSNSLFFFSCSENQLHTIPTLPESLKHLACEYNKLSSLPTLPTGLCRLSAKDGVGKTVNGVNYNNRITCIPNKPVGSGCASLGSISGSSDPESGFQMDSTYAICVPTLTLDLGEAAPAPFYSEVVVPVTVRGFSNIVSLQGSVRFNDTLATYLGAERFKLNSWSAANIGTQQAATGKLTFAWFEQNLAGQNLPENDTLFVLRFRLQGKPNTTRAITFEESPLSVMAINGSLAPVAVVKLNGSISQDGTQGLVLGNISTPSGQPLANVPLMASSAMAYSNAQGKFTLQIPTPNSSTTYEFYALSSAMDTVRATRAIDIADAFAIQRHLLAVQPFTTSYQTLAADADSSNAINIADIVKIRALSLGITNKLRILPWSFVNSSQSFSMPYAYSNMRSVTGLGNVAEQNFVAVRIGDVNDSWISNSNGARTGVSASVRFAAQPVATALNTEIEVPVTVKDFNNVGAYQFSMRWNPAHLQYVGTSNGAIQSAFGTTQIANGILTNAWFNTSGNGHNLSDNSVVFKVKFLTIGEGQSEIALNSALTAAAVYDGNVETLGFESVAAAVSIGGITSIGQNTKANSLRAFPNPAKTQVQLSFHLSSTEKVAIRLYNALGQAVKDLRGTYNAGNQNLDIDLSDLSAGIYQVQLQSSNGQNHLKLVVE